MKINKTLAALITSASLGMSGQVLAAAETDDTAAGVEISNLASFSYSVNGDVTNGESDDPDGDGPLGGVATTFEVDQKVDLILTWDDATYITADVGDDIVIKLTLSNEGNSAQSFKFEGSDTAANTDLPKLAAAADHTGKDDAQTVESWSYYLDTDGSGGTDDIYTKDAEGTALTNDVIGDLDVYEADDITKKVVTIWAVGKNLNDTDDLSQIGVEISAIASDAGGAAIEEGNTNPSGTDIKDDNLDDGFIVFADTSSTYEEDELLITAPDGTYVLLTEILVAAPIITITKEVKVTDSPFTLNNDGTSFVAIPGSTIEYTILVENNGTGDAPEIKVLDTLPSEYKLVGVAGSAIEITNLVYLAEDIHDPVETADIDSVTVATGEDLSVTGIDGEVFTIHLDLKGKESMKITFEVELL